MLITQEQIWNKLNDIEKSLNQIKQRDIETSIEEYSLHKTAKLLRVGQATVMSYVNDGKLKARIVKNKKSRTGSSYKFTLREIYRFQNQEQFIPEACLLASNELHIFDAKSIINNFHKSQKVNQ